MTGRQRILAALSHQPPDRVPIDVSGHRSSGITAMAYARLRHALGIRDERPLRVYDPIQQLAILDDEVLDRFGIDTVELGRAFCLEDEYWADWVLPDGTPCQMPVWALPERQLNRWVIRAESGRIIAVMPDGATFFDQCYWPFADDDPDFDKLPEAMAESMWCAIATPSGAHAAKLAGQSHHREQALAFRGQTDRAVLGLFGGNLLEIGQFLFRNDIFYMLLAAEPDRAEAFLDALTSLHLRNLEQYLADFGDVIDVIVFGDDLGMQSGPQISPDMYRRLFKPRHAKMWRRAKELANVKVMLHCCGGVHELIDDMIDARLDAINPVQITCRGMAPAELRRDYAGRLCFWGGGCDTRDVLPHAEPQVVGHHVRELLTAWQPHRGSYVFQQVHNVMVDVPPQNIIAMLDAARTFDITSCTEDDDRTTTID